jgi:hypothetical protein
MSAGNRNINVANFALGRKPELQQGIGLVKVGTHVPDDVLKGISAIPAVRVAHPVTIS